jgi:hypothetical protein
MNAQYGGSGRMPAGPFYFISDSDERILMKFLFGVYSKISGLDVILVYLLQSEAYLHELQQHFRSILTRSSDKDL